MDRVIYVLFFGKSNISDVHLSVSLNELINAFPQRNRGSLEIEAASIEGKAFNSSITSVSISGW
jgi:hypothetical protein